MKMPEQRRSIVLLTDDFIDPATALRNFTDSSGGDGAVVSFTGIMRATAGDGTPILSLTLETYRDVTLASMQAIARDAHERFGISRSAVIHRKGKIAPGEAIVFVATASAHRRAAFEAADYLMDRLKTQAVFWKKEETAQGNRWIEPTEGDGQDLARWDIENGKKYAGN